MTTAIDRFRALHEHGCFVLPNPHDVGMARLIEADGFSAIATTSSGLAATLGQLDMTVRLEILLAHVDMLAHSVAIPLNVDAERCFGEDPLEVAATVAAIGEVGAAGCSIEDWNPATAKIDDIETATARVRAAADGAGESGLVLTARCENHLHGVDDLDDTIERLIAYRAAGADCVYAPGLVSTADFARVVAETGVAVNALVLPGGPTVDELAASGVRRISTGGTLALIGYGAAMHALRAVADGGNYPADTPWLDGEDAAAAWAPRP